MTSKYVFQSDNGETVRFPKQWNHWLKKLGLRLHGRKRKYDRGYPILYMKGKGRVWRITCHFSLQCGDKIEDFDRWALCSHIAECDVPKTFEEMERMVGCLVDEVEEMEYIESRRTINSLLPQTEDEMIDYICGNI